MNFQSPAFRTRLRQFLSEDIGRGDLTTDALVEPGRRGRAEIVAKAAGVIAGLPLLAPLFRILDRRVRVRLRAKDGARVRPGDVAAVVDGPLRALLTGERTALNLLQRLSGTATLTRRFVDAARGTPVRILDTRKTTPGLRDLEKYAVTCGGGTNHRMGLHDAAMLKDNHPALHGADEAAELFERAARSVLDRRSTASPISGGAPARALARFAELARRVETLRRRIPSGGFLEIEASTPGRAKLAAALGADVILLDNMTSAQIRRCVRIIRRLRGRDVRIEASGNMNLRRIPSVAATGVDWISVGALTHSAPALDLSMKWVH